MQGNITTLNRVFNNTLIDSLTYSYTGNKLVSIVDKSTNNSGLVAATTNYTFDGNGNLGTNSNTTNTGQNKSYAYNLLDLPQTVTVPTGTLTYTYDAAGRKLRKVAIINGVTTNTEYIDGIQYSTSITGLPDFIQTEEGRAVPSGTTAYKYYYYLGDNLGNTRITFDSSTGTAATLQKDDYLPFGMEINRSVISPKNEYLYNKKELQEELGQYDYGARFYDPVIARWAVIDPLAEKYFGAGMYIYANDTPISLNDINGKDVDPSQIQDEKNKKGFLKFLNTKQGRQFVLNYLKKGASFSVSVDGKTHVFTNVGANGKNASDLLTFQDVQNLGGAQGVTRTMKDDGKSNINDNTNEYGEKIPAYDVRRNIVVDIAIQRGIGADEAATTFGHEAFVHAEGSQQRINALRQQLNDGSIQPGTALYDLKLNTIFNNGSSDHKLLMNDQVPHFINFIQQLNVNENTTKFTKSYNEQKAVVKEYQ